ncbi:hypothetical protein SAMN05421678_11515 [Actinopolymorpha cephalotaxi]|uniref:Heme A synthase n=1 Tax=Actinopolymorpha cephalotaxi TaxID=504797 RepID=A0A1I2YU81_9ACTN|nr:hypothetical protein [Actinopolymorpha cephalotaxi]NYH81696.1 heme A synthase [Actinopolymorpha cephalotaxi]SFH29164.1 hypothetical protein SAMN05421678_11515 [Actinopolymorpha cephalotaxi]
MATHDASAGTRSTRTGGQQAAGGPAGAPAKAWPFTAFRTLVALQAVAIFVQAITAGMIVAGRSGAKDLHGGTATLAFAFSLLTVVAAILVWKPGGGPARIIVPSAVMLVLVVVQAVLGGEHQKLLHVPLGVALFGGIIVMVMRAWSRPGGGSLAASTAASRP